MRDEQITTIGGCYVGKRTFGFIPARVTTVTIDPGTGLPPGMTVLGAHREPAPEAVAGSVQKPVRPGCVDRVKGLHAFANPPVPPFDT